ncbi:MAG TPA: hypothetical protein VD735_04325, partial [Candidatus Saccharimonadales bacterium]|nr:hypothetical protein [Candidatus Saccharimonadales bacterium]
MKTSKTRLLIVGGSVAVLVTVATTAYLLNSRSPSVIPPMSSLKEARELSQGNKESCFADNKQAIQAVRADDKYLDEAKEFSNFELTASSGIKD